MSLIKKKYRRGGVLCVFCARARASERMKKWLERAHEKKSMKWYPNTFSGGGPGGEPPPGKLKSTNELYVTLGVTGLG